MRDKDLHVIKPLTTSAFLYLFTFQRGKLLPLNGAQPFIALSQVINYAKVHKYTRILTHSHVTITTFLASATTGDTKE